MDSEFSGGRIQAPTFFVHAKFGVKMFSEFFPLPSTLDFEFFGAGRGLGTNFFGHAKFEGKNFSEIFNLQSTLDSEFSEEGCRHQHFLVMPNLRSKNFQNFSFTYHSGL